MPVVSAVVLDRRGGEALARCLRALSEQEPAPAELIVLDLASRGGQEWVREAFPQVRVVDLGGIGSAAARNAALQLATGSLVLLLDSEVRPEKDCLVRLVEAQSRSGAPLVAPRVLRVPESHRIQADGAGIHFAGVLVPRHGDRPRETTPAEARAVGACPAGCLLADRQALLHAGGYDEACADGLEDLELSLRLRALGSELLCQPAAVVHAGPKPPAGGAAQGHAALQARGRWRTFLVHYRARTLAVLAPALVLLELAGLVRAARRGRLSAWLEAGRWHLAHARETAERRRWMQRQRRCPDRALLVGGPLGRSDEADPGPRRSVAQALDAYWRVARRWID